MTTDQPTPTREPRQIFPAPGSIEWDVFIEQNELELEVHLINVMRERDAAIADREKLREQVEKLEGDVQFLTAAKTDANIARKKAIAERDALVEQIRAQQP